MIERTATIKLRGERGDWHGTVLADGDQWADIDLKGATQFDCAQQALRYALVHLTDPPNPHDALLAAVSAGSV